MQYSVSTGHKTSKTEMEQQFPRRTHWPSLFFPKPSAVSKQQQYLEVIYQFFPSGNYNFHFFLLPTWTLRSQHKQTYQVLTSFSLNLFRSLYKIHIGLENEVWANILWDSPSLNGNRSGSQDCLSVFSCQSMVHRDIPSEDEDRYYMFL